MSRPKTGSVVPNGTPFSQRRSESHSSPPARPKKNDGMSRIGMSRSVSASAPARRGASVSTTMRGTCGRSAKYRFGSAMKKNAMRNTTNAQKPAVYRRRKTSSSPRLRNQSRSVRKPTIGLNTSGTRNRAMTTIVITVERRFAGRRGPRDRRSPGRSTRDQSMFPQSPRPGPFLTRPC